MRVLIAGCGMVGTALALRLIDRGSTVWGIRRSVDRLPAGIRGIAADLSDPATLEALPKELDAVFYLASSGGRSDDHYRRAYLEGPSNLLGALHKQGASPLRIIMSSSTSLYNCDDGSWVDESTPVGPGNDFRRFLYQGEQELLSADFPATVVRFSGIYGPERIRLMRRVREGQEHCSEGPPIFTNRIHLDDCAAVLEHLLLLESPAPLYIASDHEPVERCALIRWLADQIGAPRPRTEAQTSRTRGNKRCSNRLLLETGYRFRYPTYREGYRQIINANFPQ